MRYDVPHDRAALEYQYLGVCFMWRWPDRWSLEREFMYFAGKLVYLIVLPSNQLAIIDGQYNIKQTVQCNLIKLGTHVLFKLMCRQNGELHVCTCHPYGIMEYIPLMWEGVSSSLTGEYTCTCTTSIVCMLTITCTTCNKPERFSNDCVLIRWCTSHVHHFKSA